MADKGIIKISACVIVCNEEENLPCWLESMSSLADEMVVVDTGSLDATIEIATAAGARVEKFPWIDDFAAAKNYALEKCQGQWILMLDADEYIRLQDCAGVRAAIQRYDKDKNVIGFVSPLINVDKGRNNAYISTIHQIRVFRNLPQLRYVGAIHEILRYSGQGQKNMPLVDDYAIYHTGYSRHLMPEKYKRNLQMLEVSVKKYGKRLIDDFYFADCYYGLQQYEQAIQHAKAYLDAAERVRGEENRPYGVLLQSMIFLDYPLPEILDWVKRALREFPYGSEFKIMEGYAREYAGDETGAIRCYEEAEQLYARGKEQGRGTLQSDEAGSAMPEMRERLKKLQQRLGVKQEIKREDNDWLVSRQIMDKILAAIQKAKNGQKVLLCENIPAFREAVGKKFPGISLTIWTEDKQENFLRGKLEKSNQTYDYIYAGCLLEKTDAPEVFLTGIRKMLADSGKAWFLLGDIHNVANWFSCSGYEQLLVEEDFHDHYCFITASRLDETGVFLRSRYTESVRWELVRLLRRIENGIDSRENINRLWALCAREGIDFEYLQTFMQHSLIYYERVLQLLAVSLEEAQ
ncbi:Glycosyltransferase involved in cell wall bisynthesis [Selenomonas ruminantium]|uniref:Glycosyltransferase involved in cell wall bisynthesis n=1 Tax=Selenomonas ruminantium TaxID=971 RepID=A0A1M6UM98_SELRU|nr:glycosyltransferase family 2 protein [Selenomonas ruminantium]SHK70258.1 Glycosyltransferase involved in cell wall bisynthesis [Selenomonas ruminantium]